MFKARLFSSTGVMPVVYTYAIVAGLWILLSDRALGWLFSDPATLVWASMLKGWLFVAVTSLLLYVGLGRLVEQLAAAHRRELAHRFAQQQPPPMLVSITEAAGDGIYAKDEDGRYLLFNNAAARYLDKRPEAVLGRDDRELFSAAQAEQIMAVDRRVRASGEAVNGELTLSTPAGERIFLDTRGPLRGGDGKVFGSYGILRDITERQGMEAALRRVADDLTATLQAIPDLMFEVDADGRYLKVMSLNPSLLAAPPAQLLGHTVRDILPGEAAATVLAALAAAGQVGTDFNRTITLSLPSGVHHFELSVARKPTVAGQNDHFIVVSRDITLRKDVETELRQRNQELERFNRAATERELRMIALKREVNAMAIAAGRPEPYDTSFADPAAAS